MTTSKGGVKAQDASLHGHLPNPQVFGWWIFREFGINRPGYLKDEWASVRVWDGSGDRLKSEDLTSGPLAGVLERPRAFPFLQTLDLLKTGSSALKMSWLQCKVPAWRHRGRSI